MTLDLQQQNNDCSRKMLLLKVILTCVCCSNFPQEAEKLYKYSNLELKGVRGEKARKGEKKPRKNTKTLKLHTNNTVLSFCSWNSSKFEELHMIHLFMGFMLLYFSHVINKAPWRGEGKTPTKNGGNVQIRSVLTT